MEDQKAIKINSEVLRKNYPQGKKAIPLITLFFAGFSMSAKSKIYINRFGKEIKFYGDFGFSVGDNTTDVRIFRKRIDYKQYNNFDGDVLDLPDSLKKLLKPGHKTGPL